MNFQDLYKKIASLDEGSVMSPADQPLMDTDVEECGGMMSGPGMAPKQSDSVSMTVNMSGSGQGGIRDLLAVLKNIESGSQDDPKAMVIGMEEYANEPEPEIAGQDAVIPTGDDLASKGAEAEKVNGGGNPMQPGVSESLVAQLNSLYQEIKERRVDETMYDRPALRRASDEADAQQRMQQVASANAADKARRSQEYADYEIKSRLAKIGQLSKFRPGMTDQEVSAMELAHKQKYGM